MDPLTILGGGLVGSLLAARVTRGFYTRGTFRRSARALDLQAGEGDFESRGLRRGLPVCMRFTEDAAGEQVLELAVAGLPQALAVSPVGLGDRMWRRRGERHPPLGDPLFDARFTCDGDEAIACAYLDVDTRAALLALSESWWMYCSEGQLVAHTPRDGFHTTEGLTDVLSQLLDRVEGASQGLLVEERLLKSGLTDPWPRFRRRCLNLLDGAPSPKAAARRALDSRDPELRLLGAMRLGAAAWEEQVALIRDEGPSIASRAAALSNLPAATPRTLAVSLARAMALGPDAELRRAALSLIRRQDMIELSELVLDQAVMQLDRLEAICGLARLQGAFSEAWRGDWEVGFAVIACLERVRSAEVEPLLLRYLTLDNAALRRSVIAALGRRGTRAALPELRAALAAAGRDAALRKASAAAIEAVLARAGAAGVGSLTLVDPGGVEGAVSLASSAEGGVSLADDGC